MSFSLQFLKDLCMILDAVSLCFSGGREKGGGERRWELSVKCLSSQPCTCSSFYLKMFL